MKITNGLISVSQLDILTNYSTQKANGIEPDSIVELSSSNLGKLMKKIREEGPDFFTGPNSNCMITIVKNTGKIVAGNCSAKAILELYYQDMPTYQNSEVNVKVIEFDEEEVEKFTSPDEEFIHIKTQNKNILDRKLKRHEILILGLLTSFKDIFKLYLECFHKFCQATGSTSFRTFDYLIKGRDLRKIIFNPKFIFSITANDVAEFEQILSYGLELISRFKLRANRLKDNDLFQDAFLPQKSQAFWHGVANFWRSHADPAERQALFDYVYHYSFQQDALGEKLDFCHLRFKTHAETTQFFERAVRNWLNRNNP